MRQKLCNLWTSEQLIFLGWIGVHIFHEADDEEKSPFKNLEKQPQTQKKSATNQKHEKKGGLYAPRAKNTK